MVVVLVAVTVTAFFAARRTTGEFQRYVERGGTIPFTHFARTIGSMYALQGDWDTIQPELERLSQVSGARLIVVDERGRVVGDSSGELLGKTSQLPRDLPPPVEIVAEGAPVGMLYVVPPGRPRAEDVAFISSVNRSLVRGAIIAGAVAILLTLAISDRIVNPIHKLTSAAQSMAQGDLSTRVDVGGKDEIGALARAFNTMAGSLARQEELRRNMVSDVAHELRTPLTNLRGYLEAVRDGLLRPDRELIDSLYEETMMLSRLVADLEVLAQAEAGHLHLERRPSTLSDIIPSVLSSMEWPAQDKGIQLLQEVPEDLPSLDIDPDRIRQVLRNLVENAINHTPAGGMVRVRAWREGDQVAVAVEDTGEGIPPEHLPHVFERFYRVDSSRSRQTGGSGLGLAIAKQIAEAHGGSIRVESEVGHWSVFTLTLPAA